MMVRNTVCRLTDINKSYGPEHVLGPVSVYFERSTVTGLYGSNGAGKSTLLSVAAGILRPDSGERWTAGGRICYVPQDIALYPSLSGLDNLNFWAGVYGLDRVRRRDGIKNALELVEMSNKADKPVQSLSGGMKRRLNIAAALLIPAEFLIMDEPTAGCDVHSIEIILRTIRKAADNYASVVFVSHDDDDKRVCDRIITMDKGTITSVIEK